MNMTIDIVFGIAIMFLLWRCSVLKRMIYEQSQTLVLINGAILMLMKYHNVEARVEENKKTLRLVWRIPKNPSLCGVVVNEQDD